MEVARSTPYARGHALDGGPRGISTTADYAGYGNSSGRVQFLGCHEKGIMTYHAVVCPQLGVLVVVRRAATDHAASIMTSLFLDAKTGRNRYNIRQFRFLS